MSPGRRTIIALVASTVLLLVLLVLSTWLPAPWSSSANPIRTTGIIFLRKPANVPELWIADANGGQARKLRENVTDFSVRPGGSEVVFATQPQNQPTQLEVLDTATGTSRLLVAGENAAAYAPAWSPADNLIVYERRLMIAGEEEVDAPRLWLVNTNGKSLGEVIAGSDMVAYAAVWAADGTQLAFTDPVSNETVIFNFSAKPRRIPYHGELDWSPDSSSVIISALNETSNGYAHQLVLYDLASQQATIVAASAEHDDFGPRWSPNGDQLAFVRRSRTEPNGQIWIAAVASDGSIGPARALTNTAGFDNSDPRWSPDSRTLIWTRLQIGAANIPPGIWAVNPASSDEPKLLLENALQGRWIY